MRQTIWFASDLYGLEAPEHAEVPVAELLELAHGHRQRVDVHEVLVHGGPEPERPLTLQALRHELDRGGEFTLAAINKQNKASSLKY